MFYLKSLQVLVLISILCLPCRYFVSVYLVILVHSARKRSSAQDVAPTHVYVEIVCKMHRAIINAGKLLYQHKVSVYLAIPVHSVKRRLSAQDVVPTHVYVVIACKIHRATINAGKLVYQHKASVYLVILVHSVKIVGTGCSSNPCVRGDCVQDAQGNYQCR